MSMNQSMPDWHVLKKKNISIIILYIYIPHIIKIDEENFLLKVTIAQNLTGFFMPYHLEIFFID